MVLEEEVGGADSETHEMEIPGPHTSSVASSLRLASNSKDINDGVQPVVSQGQGVTSIFPCCLIPSRLFCSVTVTGSGVPEMNIDQPRSRDDVGSDRQTEAQRACFLINCRYLNDLMIII
jgi:hypothetical protein